MKPSNKNNQNTLIESQGFGPRWTQNVGIFRPNVVSLISDTLRDVSTAVVSLDEQIIETVARNSLQSPVPDELCQMVQMFAVDFCRRVGSLDKEIVQLHQHATRFPHRRVCYTVFHDGKDHCYYDVLPDHVPKFRDKGLIWINWAENKFYSGGEERKRSDCPPARALRMLRFLCSERNAGRENIPFCELYSYVWGNPHSREEEDIRNSINVAQREINAFVDRRFISDKSKNDGAKVIRIRGKDMFNITKDAPQECCIIKEIKLS